jgi:hypothetical protein
VEEKSIFDMTQLCSIQQKLSTGIYILKHNMNSWFLNMCVTTLASDSCVT